MAELVVCVGKTLDATGWRRISGGNNRVCSLGNLTEADLRVRPPAMAVLEDVGRHRAMPAGSRSGGADPGRLGVDPGHAAGDSDPAQEQRSAVGEADLSR